MPINLLKRICSFEGFTPPQQIRPYSRCDLNKEFFFIKQGNTDTEGKQTKARVRNILKSLKKKPIFHEHPVF